MRIIDRHIEDLKTLCSIYNVEKMYLFGSALTSNFNSKSDIDLLVRFKKIELSDYFDNYMNLKEKLKTLLGREVDLLEEQALKNPILIKSINLSNWFMDEKILKWLFDIKLSLDEIDSFFEHENKIFKNYKENLMLKRAVERNLEIIGEAVNRILKRDPSFSEKITHAKAIISLRNQVIHSYDSISDENIWSILINHLPKLKSEIKILIKI
jgi:uncharacterized protein with HEPN domain/predicted nucleotidyltransferase